MIKKAIFNRNIREEIKGFIKNKDLRILEIGYKGKRLNSAVLWPKLRNPLRMIITGFFFDYIKRLPPCELKNMLYRLFGVKIGKDVVIAPYVYMDPLFPDLITIEDGVLIGGTSAVTAHEFFGKRIRVGKTIFKRKAQFGARSWIRSGISFGENSECSVYSFINKDVEDNSFVAGNPAKLIKRIYPYPLKYNNFGEMLNRHAAKNPGKIAIIDATNNKKASYKQLEDNSNKIANFLLGIGVKKGNKVAIHLPNSIEYLYLYFAILKTGAVALLLNTKLKKEELEYTIKDSDASYLFTSYNLDLKDVDIIKVKNDFFTNILKKNSHELNIGYKIDPDDDALMIYTSGTTAKPKGVILTYKNMIIALDALTKRLGYKDECTSLCMRPLFYIAGMLVTAKFAIFNSGTVILYDKFHRTLFWEAIEKYRINFVELSTSMIPMLLNPPEDISKRDISSLKFIGVGGMPLSVEVAKRFEEAFKIPLFECYGLTECTCLATYTPIDIKKRKFGSAGTPLASNEIRVMDDYGNFLARNTEGEVVLRGPTIMKGYYNKPELNKEAFTNGWLRTGDIGYLDRDGYLYITGRRKELIKRGGENISPREIDEVLYKHPAIKEAAAVGVPDKFYGEEVKAFVALKKGKRASEKEIIDFCKKHIAEFKCPKSVEFIKELPKGPTGKILRRELK